MYTRQNAIRCTAAALTFVVWFCHGDGNNQEETMARAIVKSAP